MLILQIKTEIDSRHFLTLLDQDRDCDRGRDCDCYLVLNFHLAQIASLFCCASIWWIPLVHLNFLVRPSVPGAAPAAPEPLSHSLQQKPDKATRLHQFKGHQGPRIEKHYNVF